jgi:hypothetical protein
MASRRTVMGGLSAASMLAGAPALRAQKRFDEGARK